MLALQKLLHGDFRLLTQGNVSPKVRKTIPIAEHVFSFVQRQDVAFHLCNIGAAAPRKLTKQPADEQRQSAAINISSKFSQQYDNLDLQPAALQQHMQPQLLELWMSPDLVEILGR